MIRFPMSASMEMMNAKWMVDVTRFCKMCERCYPALLYYLYMYMYWMVMVSLMVMVMVTRFRPRKVDGGVVGCNAVL